MKVSFVTTVFNEELSIGSLLHSLSEQIRQPDEIIIVDAGSTDRTRSVISNFKFPISNKNVKIATKKGNRAVGRNEGIKRAKGNIIAVSDAGCILDKHWLQRLTKSFTKERVDIVSGFYLPKTNTVFEKCLATYTCVMPDRIDKDNFLPSSRSVAFRKTVWERSGGYPEYLDTCEDLVFAKKNKLMGAKFTFVRNAIVYWPQRKSIIAAFKQFFSYAKGDGQALYIRPQTPLLFFRWFILISLLTLFGFTRWLGLVVLVGLLGILYVIWAVGKNYRYVRHWKGLFWLWILQFVSDCAVFLGMSLGLLVRVKKML